MTRAAGPLVCTRRTPPPLSLVTAPTRSGNESPRSSAGTPGPVTFSHMGVRVHTHGWVWVALGLAGGCTLLSGCGKSYIDVPGPEGLSPACRDVSGTKVEGVQRHELPCVSFRKEGS